MNVTQSCLDGSGLKWTELVSSSAGVEIHQVVDRFAVIFVVIAERWCAVVTRSASCPAAANGFLFDSSYFDLHGVERILFGSDIFS